MVGSSQDVHRREVPGHRGTVLTVAWNQSGRKLASGSDDQTLRIWDITAGVSHKNDKCEAELRGHADGVCGVLWHPKKDDQVLSTDVKSIRLWDIRQSGSNCVGSVSSVDVLFMAWHPDGQAVVLISRSSGIYSLDVRKMKAHKKPSFADEVDVNEVAFLNPDMLLATTRDGTIKVLKYPSFEETATMYGHCGYCFSVAISPDQRHVATGGADATVALWDTEQLVCTATDIRPDAPIRALSFSCDGQMLAYAPEKKDLEVLDIPSGAPLYRIPIRLDRAPESSPSGTDTVAFNPKYPNVLAWGGVTHPEPRTQRDPIGGGKVSIGVLPGRKS